MRKLSLVLVVLVVLAGCSGGGEPNPENTSDSSINAERLGDAPSGGTFRYYDNETGVVCYYIDDYGGSGESLDCLAVNGTVDKP